MKIALVTIHKANNYGALLQAYALQEALSTFGDTELVDYDNEYLSMTLEPIRVSFSFHGILGMGKDLCRLLPRYRLIKKFKKFMAKRFVMTQSYSQNELLKNKLPGYDYYVVGSDQVWNSTCVSRTSDHDPVYFLEFAPEGAKKVSYASSVGGYVFTEEESKQIPKYIDSFEAVSVREKNTQKYLNSLTGKNIEHVLDPTLLLSKNQWEELVGQTEYTDNRPYILLYTVPKVALVRKAVAHFSDKLGVRVIAIDQGLSAGACVDKHIRDAGPEDLLSLFSGADFVVTDSFHGVCFSINLERPFVALSPGKHANRVESLLSIVGLNEQYVSNELDFDGVSLKIDFSEPRLRLEKARKESYQFLHQAFSTGI